MRAHTEEAFEQAIVASLVDDGWERGQSDGYDPELALDRDQLLTFIGATQMDAWNTLLAYAGDDQDFAQREFCRLVARELDSRGALDVLRNGVKDRGVRIQLAYFRPAHTVAEDALDDYRRNRCTVHNQLRYSPDHGNTLDLALFLNGIPVATAELKNHLTGQTVKDAKDQYRDHRDPKDLIFAKRALVHFAVDPELVFVTTRLAGQETRFLPFNQGTGGPGNIGGAGNPPADDGYASAYLWRQVRQRQIAKDRAGAGTVDRRGLQLLLRLGLQPGQQDQHHERGVLPDQHHHDCQNRKVRVPSHG